MRPTKDICLGGNLKKPTASYAYFRVFFCFVLSLLRVKGKSSMFVGPVSSSLKPLVMDIEALRFPVGPFELQPNYTEEDLDGWMSILSDLPMQLQQAVDGMPDEQLQAPYRPDGWTRTQVIHHLADSHMNCFIRCKLTLTELDPTVKPYAEADWAKTPDATDVNIGASWDILHGLHYRWNQFWLSLKPEDWSRQYYHPENQRHVTLAEALQFYAWHSRHHLAHVTSAWMPS